MTRVAQHLKDYWPLWGIVVAVATALTTYLGLPKRVEQVEAGQATLEDTFEKYLHSQEEALAEQRGYQRALNQQIMRQPSVQPEPWRETDRNGEWCCTAPTYDECWQPVNQWIRCP